MRNIGITTLTPVVYIYNKEHVFVDKIVQCNIVLMIYLNIMLIFTLIEVALYVDYIIFYGLITD